MLNFQLPFPHTEFIHHPCRFSKSFIFKCHYTLGHFKLHNPRCLTARPKPSRHKRHLASLMTHGQHILMEHHQGLDGVPYILYARATGTTLGQPHLQVPSSVHCTLDIIFKSWVYSHKKVTFFKTPPTASIKGPTIIHRYLSTAKA